MTKGRLLALSIAIGLGSAAINAGVASANTYYLKLTPESVFGVGGTGILTVDGTHGFDVTSLDIMMANGVKLDFGSRQLEHASALINAHGNLIGLAGQDTLGSSAIVFHPHLTAQYIDHADPKLSTFEYVSDPPAAGAPGPVAAAGLPGMLFAISTGLFVWWRRKRNLALTSS